MHTPPFQPVDTRKPISAWAISALLALRDAALVFTASLVLAGCSMLGPIDGPLSVSKPLLKPTREPMLSRESKIKNAELEPVSAEGPQFFKTPVTLGSTAAPVAKKAAAPVDATDGSLSAVTLDGIPLPQFINTVYATILKRNVSLDPAVQTRTDLVSLRTGKPQSPEQLSAAVQAVLKSYAVSINEFDGLVRAVPSAGVGGASPEIIRGRAQPDVPGALRPVFYLVELDNTSQANVVGWVRTLFQGRVTITEDPPRNAILLSGQSDSVMAAVEAIQTLDKPGMRGRYSARMTPVFWSATDMATKLVDVLTAQGFSASTNPSSPTPILVMPIAPINSVIVFAVSEESLNHTLRWARDLDQTAPSRSGGRFITYYVRNTDALEVAKTLQEVMGGGGAVAAAPGAPAAPRPAGSSKVVVNSAANSIIIQSSPAEFQQIYGLLQELDRPTRSALIMATVAEVSLSDTEQFGFNWLLTQFNAGGYIVNGGMGPPPGGAATSADGIALNIASVAGDPRALLTALATSKRVRVLSNPSVVAVSGQSASIQVGQDVPIVTGQISNANTGTGSGQGVLQTIQYRNVGIILRVKPVIRAGGRVDLEIAQEVSGVASGAPGVGSSPIVNTRRVDTRLSTVDGNTMLIGGLISEQRDGGNTGIPYLKDIPILGGLFKTGANSQTTRTELVLLITPYVMEDDFDSRAITDAFRGQFSWGGGIPFASKVASEPVASAGEVADAKPLVKESSPAYVVPAAPVEAPAAARSRVRDMGPPGESAKSVPEASISPVATKAILPSLKPGVAAPAAGASTPGKPVTDEALKQELLDAIRGVKR